VGSASEVDAEVEEEVWVGVRGVGKEGVFGGVDGLDLEGLGFGVLG
jgi:hypothetical protein